MSQLPKFVPLEHVMTELSISRSQAYALVRSGQLATITRARLMLRVRPTIADTDQIRHD